MGDQNYEQEIDLKDLIFAVLRKWRIIICTALIFGIMLGGYKFSAGYMHKGDGQETEELQKVYNEDLELYEKAKLAYTNQIENLKNRIVGQEDYLSNSVLQSISPYSKPVASADIFVKVNPVNQSEEAVLVSDDADAIVNAYASIVNNTVNTLNFEDSSGNNINSQYLKELITTGTDYEGNVLNVEVTYNNDTEAKQILDLLLEKVNNEHAMVQSNLGSHELIIMNVTTAVTTDQSMADKQQKSGDLILTLNKSMSEMEKALEDLKAPLNPVGMSATGHLKGAVKYGVLGIMLGGFLAVFCASVVYLLRNKLDSEKELKERYGLRILGVFSQKPQKGVFSGVDAWLDQLQGIRFREPSEVYDIIAANVENYMKADQDLMILGVTSGGQLEQIAEELSRRQPGLAIQAAEAAVITADTLKRLSNVGQIILVEERGLIRYDAIQDQIEMIKSLNKDIIGCIVL